MDKIKLSNLNIDFFNGFSGSDANVSVCEYQGNLYVYKKFLHKKCLGNIISRLEAVSKLNVNGCVFPKYLVQDDFSKRNILGYLTEYIMADDGKQLITLDKNVEILNNLKNIINDLHKHGVIHGNLYCENILIERQTLRPYLINFDHCKYKSDTLQKKYKLTFEKLYINKYGINEGLDIFLFNILTFSVLNGTYYSLTQKNIMNKNYGVFNDTLDERKICDSFLLTDNVYNGDYLIDAYQKKINRKI